MTWVWEVKSVNGRNLDLRLRLPHGFEALEAEVRKLVPEHLARGNVQIALVVDRSRLPLRYRVNRELLQQLLGLTQELGDDLPAAPPRLDGLLAIAGCWSPKRTARRNGRCRTQRRHAGRPGRGAGQTGWRPGRGGCAPGSGHRRPPSGLRRGGRGRREERRAPAGGAARQRSRARSRNCLRARRACPRSAWRRRRRCWRPRPTSARSWTACGPLAAARDLLGRRRPSAGARFPVPGVQPRGQHALLQVRRRGADPHRPRAQGGDRQLREQVQNIE